jgi:hypothetical protein
VWRLPRREGDEAAADEGIGRILALSDGVFAIAITLLILEIAVPAKTSDAGLTKALLGLWPRYLAYVVSFVVIARFWVVHRLTFRLIARDDAVLVWLNLLLLMFVASCRFPPLFCESTTGRPRRRFCMRPRWSWRLWRPRPPGGTHPAGETCCGRTSGVRRLGPSGPAACRPRCSSR